MSTGNTPRDDAELEAFLARQSPVSTDYDNLELVEPTAELDARILVAAKAAATTAGKSAPAGATAEDPASRPVWNPPSRPPEPDTDDDDDDEADAPPPRRPRWMVPAALAASVLVAVGIGFALLDISPSAKEGSSALGAMFAKRARARSEAEKVAAEAAAAAAAEQELEVMVMEAPPPPPSFEPDRPQVADLKASIALIRRELVPADEPADERDVPVEARSFGASAQRAADATTAEALTAPTSPASAIQSRERRLAKILEFYDEGNPDLARDALEIFLRDFADDPVSQRILGVKR